MARIASVIGRHFDLPTLSAVLETANGQIDVERSMQDLVSFDLLQAPDGGEPDHSFRHTL